MSLQTLREKLNQISRKHPENTFTFDISEAQKWMKGNTPEDWLEYIYHVKEKAQKWMKGNTPEDWLEYIYHVKEKVDFPNDIQRHNAISELFEGAFKDLDSSKHKNNEAYAQLFVNYARLKSSYIPEDATMIFNQARSIVRKFAIVHVAWAEFELKRDNHDKARKILEKGLLFEAKPVHLIQTAMQKLKAGQTSIYDSPGIDTNKTGEDRWRKFSSGSESSEELRNASQSDNLSANLNLSIIPKHESVKAPEPMRPVPSISTGNQYPARVPAGPADNSLRKGPGLRHCRSTPLLQSEKRVNPGPPARVRRTNLQFPAQSLWEETGQEEMDTMDSFKPLTPHNKNATFGSHAHTSGYLSMTQTSDHTIPMETKETKPQEQVQPKEEPAPAVEKPPLPVVQEALPKPVVPPPQPQPQSQVPETPNNKNVIGTPMPSLQMITVNDQQYGVIGVMGHGGSSKVYQVLDANHKLKAIKVVNLDNANEQIVDGYKNEIKLLRRLQYCDKVIKMYDSEYKAADNKLYVVMEAGNEDLASFFRSRTKDRRPLSDNLIRFYWEIMLEGVQALHKEGIIHSDLKPANFLLVGGNLKLIDFGIAKALQQDKTSVILETQIGTLNYMSPEAIMDCCGNQPGQGKPKFKIGVKSDVWSLGCILYNMVYSRTPFQHIRNDFYKLQAIMNDDFPIDFPDIPNKHLLDVIKRCLCRDPKSRPSIDVLLQHPYLRGDKEEKETSPGGSASGEKPLPNNQVEALISLLADKSSLSPGGIRNLIHKTISTDQNVPETKRKEPSHNSHNPASTDKPDPAGNPVGMKPKSLVQRPAVAPVTHKQVRAPLNCLNLQDFKPASHQPQKNTYNPSGS